MHWYLHQGMIVSYTAVFVPSPKLTLLRDKEGFVGDHEDARDFHLFIIFREKIESNTGVRHYNFFIVFGG